MGMRFILATAALTAGTLSSLATGYPLVAARQGDVNICAAVQGTQNGCVESAAAGKQALFFTCDNGTQTLFTCDGGCRQQNAANLPTCDNGKLFNGTIAKRATL